MRRIARLLKVHRKTVARRLVFLAGQAQIVHAHSISDFLRNPSVHVQFDDLETSEHTKCKPLSVCMAVDQKTRRILAFEVSSMPAKGHLAKIARKKYGFRPDHRKQGLRKMFSEIKAFCSSTTIFTSDEHPYYPICLRDQHPIQNHRTVKSRRACIAGQGELKKIGYDPLFSLNHTFAMLSANINRLIRRTWSTTKKLESLRHHIMIYAAYHNTKLV